MRRRGSEVRNPRGEPHGFIVATDARKATVCLDLRAGHTYRRVTLRDTRPRSLSSPTKIASGGSLSRSDRTLSHRGDVGQKNLFTKLIWAHNDRRSAHLGSQSQRAVPMSDRPINYRDSRTQASLGPRSVVGSQPGRHWIKFPRIEYHDSLKNIQLMKNQAFQHHPRRARYYPLGDST